MRTTIIIDDKLLDEARRATGIRRKSDLVRAGLEELVQRAAARRLIALGGSDPNAFAAPRRRPVARVRRKSAA